MTTLKQKHQALLFASHARVVEARRIASLTPEFHCVSLKNDRNEHSEIEMKARHFLFAWCNYDDATFADSLDMRWKDWMQNKQA
jgi:hypothetical protein